MRGFINRCLTLGRYVCVYTVKVEYYMNDEDRFSPCGEGDEVPSGRKSTEWNTGGYVVDGSSTNIVIGSIVVDSIVIGKHHD